MVPALNVVANALKGLMQNALASGLVIVQIQLFAPGAVQHNVLNLCGKIIPGRGQLETVFLGQRLKIHAGNAVGPDVAPAAGLNGAVQNGNRSVRNHQRGIHLQLAAQTRAGGAGAEGIVEREHAGRQLLHGDAAILAGIVLREHEILLLPQEIDHHQSAGQGGCGLHRVGQTLLNVRTDDQTVHNDLDVMLNIFFQFDLFVQFVQISIHTGADITRSLCVLEHLGVFALFAPDHRRHHLNTGSLRKSQNLVNDLVNGLLTDLLAALVAMGGANSGPQQTQIVINFSDGAHRGTGVLAGGLLVNGDGRGKALDIVHIRLVHLAQEHAGIGAQRLHIAALALGIDRIKCQRGFAGTGKSRHHHQFVTGDRYVNIF